MTGRFRKVALLAVFVIACSSAKSSTSSQTQAVCGNGVLEAGEQCDYGTIPTCAQVTGDQTNQALVNCVSCMVELSPCRRGPSAGMGGASYGGAPPFPTTGGVTGVGGFQATVTGGAPPFGGVPMTGGAPPFGGFPATGGDPGNGGVPAMGGSPATGGFVATGGDVGNGGTPSTGGSTSTGPLGDLDALRQVCVDTINQYRATLSLPPLNRASASVETCSDTGAQQDATAGVAHGSAGNCPGMSAQDTCPGWNPSSYGGVANALKACLQGMWAEGDPPEGRDQCIQEYFSGNTACFLAHGHYLNMSSTSNSVVSCGFYLMPNGKVWMNQDFGK